MISIKSVRVAPSNIEGNGPGFAVLVDPCPSTEHGMWQIAQKIHNALIGVIIDDE